MPNNQPLESSVTLTHTKRNPHKSDHGSRNPSLNNVVFGSVTRDEGTVITTVSGSSAIGTVALTEGTTGTDTVGAQSNASPYTFDGNATAGAYGNFAPTEQDVWRLSFNDLGIGTFTITLYLGHSNIGRSFDMDIALTDGGGNDSATTEVSPLSSLGSAVGFAGGDAFTHTVTVTTTTADAGLTLTHGGTGGSSGGALFAGYTVTGTIIPEPGSLALLAMGGLCMVRRRR